LRFLVIAHIQTEAFNKAMKDDPDKATKNLEDYLNNVKAEAVYFTEDEGDRAIYFIVDMQTVDMMPIICEPLFQGFNARIELKPVMVLEDVKKGVHAI
jgi:hypothetical protein